MELGWIEHRRRLLAYLKKNRNLVMLHNTLTPMLTLKSITSCCEFGSSAV